MPKPKASSVESDALRRWKLRGASSPLLDARLKFMEVEGVARYVRFMGDLPCHVCGFNEKMHNPNVALACPQYSPRVFPNFLPTQASGRWSTTNPPMTNFPPDCVAPTCTLAGTEHGCVTSQCWSAREVVGPDEGTYWVHFDLDGIEARWAAADSGDQDDLQAFRNGWDLHTITACRAYNLPLPPVLTKLLHTDLSCEPWRNLWVPPWSGAEDRRRHIIKTMRYATLYGISSKGVLQAKGIEKLGLKPEELVAFATRYLRSKPALIARKRQVWDDCAKTGVSYTWFGRRRRLYGDWNTRAKEGWSHRISGTVTDYMNQALIAITDHFPECHLVLNSHDGATIAFPLATDLTTVLLFSRGQVEREVTSPTGHIVPVTASWEQITSDLVRHGLQ